MNRLTTKFHRWNAIEFNQYAENGYSKFTLLQEQMGDKRFITGDAIDLLSAYEDTGLTPDEIRQMQSELEMYRKEWEYVYCLDCEYYSCDDNQNENCPHQHECDLCNSEDGRHRFDRPHYKQKDSANMKEGNSDTRT